MRLRHLALPLPVAVAVPVIVVPVEVLIPPEAGEVEGEWELAGTSLVETVLLGLRQQVHHAHRHGERAEVRVEVGPRVRAEVGPHDEIRLWHGGHVPVNVPVQPVPILQVLLLGGDLVVVVAELRQPQEVQGAHGPALAVLPQLLQLERLAVLAPHVHEQRVVGNAEDARRLRRRHLLVPHVLQRLGQLGVGPGAGRAAARRRVLTLGSTLAVLPFAFATLAAGGGTRSRHGTRVGVRPAPRKVVVFVPVVGHVVQQRVPARLHTGE